MDAPGKPSTSHNLFEVYLRLRPPPPGAGHADRILNVEKPGKEGARPSHITLNPPTDRRRAIEKFAFTRVFEEDATQLDVFDCADIATLAEGVLAPQGGEGTDAVVATLGVTGSGKTHTILGSKSQRGLTQLALDVLFHSIDLNMLEASSLPTVLESLQACDPSESLLSTAPHFLDSTYADPLGASRTNSRAATPMGGDHGLMSPPPRRNLQRPSALPQTPDVSGIHVACDASAEYAVVVSMYEVHNDRIYDLLTPPAKSGAAKDIRRRPLLFKSTELSPDRKVVAGLRKVVCTSLKDAIIVLEAGLVERRVAGTGSNSVSSRSHGFFCFEVKRRTRSRRPGPWVGSKLTIVDLAGSERAREAKTQGATLVEAGKINESLMYLGQCLQTQSEAGSSTKPNVVPYRQCKLTELLFSNSFPSASAAAHPHAPRRNPQKGVMVVTADALGDFNATSQILRYSALAREVTVPRIPSITATILAHAPQAPIPPPTPSAPATTTQHHPRPFMPPGPGGCTRTHTPPGIHPDERATMEIAALEIARMSDELEQQRDELERQSEARLAAEAHLLSMEERMLDLEAAVRDECATEFEQRLTLELARFKASLALEQERSDEHWDRKVDVLERGLDSSGNNQQQQQHQHHEGDKENVLVEDMAQEVERLRRENAVLKRELTGRSPSKRMPLAERDDFVATQTLSPSSSLSLGSGDGGMASVSCKLERMRVSSAGGDSVRTASSGSPAKKVRKLPTKRWEELDLED
ncbi:kinesin motor domain-containing protein [Hirsutella rhossiliensis]|uniref:Kinesin-like protein n=1 Tax=Hirsutella rhossiliensis TaxID=111463 RepID=A0A9P8SNL4_9HYPO|nr:kinesin motor domain-containing protein [Hirsutella rhossiliensis]KAH0968524.1 kinesin motor domain-containing protein [Hirsutella rhossiliensis]